jgi:hypothetical protein
MILVIESSIPSFKTVHFHNGLNVVLADASPGVLPDLVPADPVQIATAWV